MDTEKRESAADPATPPLKCRNRTRVVGNSQFEVFLDHLEDSGGETVPDYLVVAPKHRGENGITGVAVLPVHEGRIALLRIYRHPVAAWSWEIPRGFVEPGEDRCQSLIRELEEETGLTCGREAIQELGTIAPDAGILTAKIQLFAAIRCRLLRPFRSNELGHRALEFLEPREADRMIRDSVIQDPCTLVALMRLLQPGSPLQKDR